MTYEEKTAALTETAKEDGVDSEGELTMCKIKDYCDKEKPRQLYNLVCIIKDSISSDENPDILKPTGCYGIYQAA